MRMRLHGRARWVVPLGVLSAVLVAAIIAPRMGPSPRRRPFGRRPENDVLLVDVLVDNT